jgi:peptidyl-prolyl isomerase G (cyclophilin G)
LCYSTTQPAPHLDNVHVVFGRVVGGVDVVRQIESLPVDANSRPLQDAKIVKCGELVRQVKVKKDKKKKKEENENEEESSGDEKKKKKHKKDKKKEKKDKRHKEKADADSEEEGELKDLHPLATVTDINPEDIPDVPFNKFLMRGPQEKEKDKKFKKRKDDFRSGGVRERNRRDWDNHGFRRDRPITTKSGRMIKGRGKFRYRTPSRSRSRSGTPLHWRKEESRVIKLSEFEKLEAERKKREERRKLEKASKEENRQENEVTDNAPEKQDKEVDYNALDYEENQSEEDEAVKKQVPSLVQYPLPGSFNPNKEQATSELNAPHPDEMINNAKSEVMAMALGVQVKTGEESPPRDGPISGFDKKNKQNEVIQNNDHHTTNLMKLAGQSNNIAKNRNLSEASKKDAEVRTGRNKFETEKPDNHNDENRASYKNGGYREPNRRRVERRPFDERRPVRRQFGRRERGRYVPYPSRERKYRRSPRRSRSKHRQRSRSRRHSRTRRSPSKERPRNRSKSVTDDEKKAKKQPESDKEEKKVDDTEEKYKKLLILRKQMELLEMKKKKEVEQVIVRNVARAQRV